MLVKILKRNIFQISTVKYNCTVSHEMHEILRHYKICKNQYSSRKERQNNILFLFWLCLLRHRTPVTRFIHCRADFFFRQQQMQESFNFLIIGRCGSGKSATTRELTGCDSVQVRNSPNSVTKSVTYYESTPSKVERVKVRFGVLDIPGLDQLENRKLVRQLIISEMEQRGIDFDAILYTVDCVTRDTVDNKRIFHFLNELPWSLRDTKECLIPILTKYDNLIFDAEDQNTKKTLEQFAQIFSQNNYEESWKHNSLYWVNSTKNIQRKMAICNEIKEIYETQLQKLLTVLAKKKTKLTRARIQQFLQEQHKYILRKVKSLIKSNQIMLRAASCMISNQLTIQLSQQHTQNYTAVTLGGMGVMLTQVIKSDLGKAAFAVGTILVAGGVILRNLLTESSSITDKQQERHQLKMKFDKTYIIESIYKEMSEDLKVFEQKLEFKIEDNALIIQVPEYFEGEFLTIQKSSVTECYMDDIRLQRNEKGDFSYSFQQQEQTQTLVSSIKLRFIVLVPEQSALLERFEQESYNFKKELDVIY